MSPEFVRNALEHLMATKYNEPFSKLGLPVALKAWAEAALTAATVDDLFN
jgi:hypothetical protein